MYFSKLQISVYKTNQGDYFGSRFFYANFWKVTAMNGITELAELLKERGNSDGCLPIFGIELTKHIILSHISPFYNILQLL